MKGVTPLCYRHKTTVSYGQFSYLLAVIQEQYPCIEQLSTLSRVYELM